MILGLRFIGCPSFWIGIMVRIIRIIQNMQQKRSILALMKPRPNTQKFTFLIDRNLLADLTKLQHRLELASVTAVIHLFLRRAVDKELGKSKKGE